MDIEPPSDAVLSVRDLVVQFRTEDGYLTAVDHVSYDLRRGQTLGIVGESGSGKSVTNLAVMGLLPTPSARIPSGQVMFSGRDLLRLSAAEMRHVRGNRIAMIFQDPMTSLNPFLRVSQQLIEMLRVHQGIGGKAADELAISMLDRVGIPDASRRFHDYPHQFSGGMRQRVMVAMMLLNTPEVLIADEPTTALDVTIQAQILDLLRELQSEFKMSIALITHDLGVVASMADHVMVMYGGRVMESGPVREIFASASHPYTLGLLRSLPRLDTRDGSQLYSIPGRPPDLHERTPGCPFASRCEYVAERCWDTKPPVVTVGPGHRSTCFAVDDVRAAVRRVTS